MKNEITHSKDNWTFEIQTYVNVDYGLWEDLAAKMNKLVKSFAERLQVPSNSVRFELITESRRYKRMVVLYVPTALLSEQPTDKINFNMMDWLTD